jgi:hypothetical protein
MAFFALVFLFVALILIGIGFVIGLLAISVTAVLLAVGILSSSVVVALLSRRPAAGIRAFLLQCALLAGVPSGILCAWLAHGIFTAYGTGWTVLLYGALGGAAAGLIIALFLDFIFRRLHSWASATLGPKTRRDLTTPVV